MSPHICKPITYNTDLFRAAEDRERATEVCPQGDIVTFLVDLDLCGGGGMKGGEEGGESDRN